jgi:hypothetical protein
MHEYKFNYQFRSLKTLDPTKCNRVSYLRISNRRGRHLRHGRSGQLWLHHSRSGTTYSSDRSSKPRLSLNHRSSRNTTPSSPANPRPSGSSRRSSLGTRLVGRRRPLDSHGDDLLATEENETESAAVLAVGRGLGLRGREAAELLAVAEDEVHVAVEGHELADQLSAVLDGDAHPVVDILEHLRALGARHLRLPLCSLSLLSLRLRLPLALRWGIAVSEGGSDGPMGFGFRVLI